MFISKSKKSPFFQLTYEVNGKRTTISTKTDDLQSAQKFMRNFKIKKVKPLKKVEQIKEEIKPILISTFKNEYLVYVGSSKSKNYTRSIQYSFKKLLESTGDIPLKNLNLRVLDQFLTLTFARTPSGAATFYRTLKAAFSKAVHWDYISENPLKRIKSPKVAKTFPVFISESELNAILGKTEEEYLRNIFLITFYTGMRLSEIVNMKLSWLDMNSSQISVRCSASFTTKNKKERVIPFNDKLKQVFTNRVPKMFNIDSNEYIFTNSLGRKLNDDFVSKKFKEAVREAKLDDKIHFHSLRHSFASLLVQRGVSLYVVKELLGHEDLATTQIYSHLQQQNLRDAVNLL